MKKIIFILVAIILTASICATDASVSTESNNYKVLDNVSAEKMYFEAKNMLVNLICGDISCDYNNSIEVNGILYYRVTEEKYSDYESVISLYKNYFTDSYVDSLFSRISSFIEHEGKSYYDGGTLASNIYCGSDTYLNYSKNNNQAEIIISTEILDHDFSPSGRVEHTFQLKFEDGCWKFDSFYLTNYSYDFNSAPQTGTDVFVYAAVAVVALAAAVVLKKRRRRA